MMVSYEKFTFLDLTSYFMKWVVTKVSHTKTLDECHKGRIFEPHIKKLKTPKILGRDIDMLHLEFHNVAMVFFYHFPRKDISV